MYLIDTNICIYIINKKSEKVLYSLKKKSSKKIFISSITVAELEYGVVKSRYPERNKIALLEFLSFFKILHYTDSDASQYGKIRADLERKGKIIGNMDLLIASQASNHNLVLVTNNTKVFERIPDITIENWCLN